jgi:hypothetical protein
MRVFIAIPIPLLILVAIVLGGVTDKDPVLSIPPNINRGSIKVQVQFGDRARRYKSFDLALKYCAKGTESADIALQSIALTCMMRSHKGKNNIDDALSYAYRVRESDESQGFGSKYVDDDIAELEKLR